MHGEERLSAVLAAASEADLRRAYDDWAERYDDDLRAFGYTYPTPFAGLVCRYVAHAPGSTRFPVGPRDYLNYQLISPANPLP